MKHHRQAMEVHKNEPLLLLNCKMGLEQLQEFSSEASCFHSAVDLSQEYVMQVKVFIA